MTVSRPKPRQQPKIDPITAQVVAGALNGIALEMGHKLARMSYSSIIRESEGFGAAILDADCQQFAECAYSPPSSLVLFLAICGVCLNPWQKMAKNSFLGM